MSLTCTRCNCNHPKSPIEATMPAMHACSLLKRLPILYFIIVFWKWLGPSSPYVTLSFMCLWFTLTYTWISGLRFLQFSCTSQKHWSIPSPSKSGTPDVNIAYAWRNIYQAPKAFYAGGELVWKLSSHHGNLRKIVFGSRFPSRIRSYSHLFYQTTPRSRWGWVEFVFRSKIVIPEFVFHARMDYCNFSKWPELSRPPPPSLVAIASPPTTIQRSTSSDLERAFHRRTRKATR